MEENWFENVIHKMAAILSHPQFVNDVKSGHWTFGASQSRLLSIVVVIVSDGTGYQTRGELY